MGKIMLNGVQYSGLTNVEGAFIDTDNVIKAITTLSNNDTYTATEDCCIVFFLKSTEIQGARIELNNIPIIADFKEEGGTNQVQRTYLFVQKGQTIKYTGDTTVDGQGTYAVYGIQSGSNVINAENNYSTDEKVIGKWIDGSDIYQKTYDITTPLTNNANNKIDANFDSSLYYPISVEATCVLSDGVNVLNAPYVNLNANPTQFISVFVADGLHVGVKGLSINSASVTIKYIKLSS